MASSKKHIAGMHFLFLPEIGPRCQEKALAAYFDHLLILYVPKPRSTPENTYEKIQKDRKKIGNIT